MPCGLRWRRRTGVSSLPPRHLGDSRVTPIMAARSPRFAVVFGWLLAASLLRGAEGPAWQAEAQGRHRPLPVPASGHTGFSLVPPATTGLQFTNRLPIERSLTNHILLNGSGVALGDVDGDGRCDVFLGGLGGGSALYRNQGNWRFEAVTAKSLASAAGASGALSTLDVSGALLVDLDGDGAPELLLNTVGRGTRCWRNDGHGNFRDVTESSGLGSASGGSSFTAADVDGDGDLDLYVVRYRSSTVRDAFQQQFRIQRIQGRPVVVAVNGRPTTDPDLVGRFTVDESGQVTEHGEADQLFRNEGGCRFVAVSFTDGSFLDERGQPLTSPPYDWGLTAMFRDINGDGAPDLYVCNDLGSPDRIWINDGRGRFRAIARTSIRKTSWFSMGVDFGDLNRDGRDDFLVTDMLSRDPVRRQIDAAQLTADAESFTGLEARPQCPRNTVFAGRGDGTFAEVGWASGLAASDWSWSPVLLDVDLDGFEDVLITTGFERDVQDGDVAAEIEAIRRRDRLSDAASLELRRRFPSLALPNLAFRNRGDFTFEEVGGSWGFDQTGISQGMALADLDGDGDLDAVVNNQNGPAFLLRNDSTAPRIRVRLQGAASNTAGTGARIEVSGGPMLQRQEMVSGGRFLSGDDAVRVFAAGARTNRLTVRVRWRSGSESVMEGVPADEELEVEESAARSAATNSMTALSAPLFEEVSDRLGHRHSEEPFDDFLRQPLLPGRLSTLGPGVAWGDLNGDGSDDLIVGGGRGGTMGAFLNDGHGRFSTVRGGLFDRATPLDQAGILIWPRGTNAPWVLAALSRYERPDAMAGVRILDLGVGAMRFGGADLPASIGPLASADVNGDGTLDLFVGGRVVPGRYPTNAGSALFLGRDGALVADPASAEVLKTIGMAVGAVFSDLDSDGDPDLVVTCDWGAIRILFNEQGRWVEREMPLNWADPRGRPSRMQDLKGWWAGVASVDLDEDGRMDLVVANRGPNTLLGGGPGWETRLYSGDLDGNGTVDLLEAAWESGSRRWIPKAYRDRLVTAVPTLKDRFPTRRSMGEASVDDIAGEEGKGWAQVSVNTAESLALLNRGDHYEVRVLPAEAQWAPAFGVVAADFDGDGHEDVFLSQNFSDVGPDRDPEDSGLGLMLRGDGRGGLASVSAHDSGIRVFGQQRGAAVADFDGDGRPDLVVGQPGEATRLFLNQRGIPGLRVRLRSGPGNPTATGAQVRWLDSERARGPMKEVRCGGGYWSQDSSVLLLSNRGTAHALRVRWPQGAVQEFEVPTGAREVEIVRDPPGLQSR